MNKLLISWVAFNNDFQYENHQIRGRRVNEVKEDGPTFNLHRYFWEGENYCKHILLNSNSSDNEKNSCDRLIGALRKEYSKHTFELKNIFIDDVINVAEIFSKLHPFLIELQDEKIDIFISPGTPAMQTAWYLLGSHFKANTTLFQVRGKEHTKEKKQPEKIIVELSNSVLPSNIIIAQKEIEKPVIQKGILQTESIKPIYERAKFIANTNDVGCLILGENGTGKENLANFIHENSSRNKKPFVAVNCAAFSDDLLRSELFGHEKGSFTGADEKKIGVFEAANGGTVFLDEIGDVSSKMQVSLLRVLQSKKIQRVGSSKEIDIDVRVIAATNKEIEKLTDQGEFRTDLFYRLAVTELRLPPLRERGKKEINKLIEYFNDRYSNLFIHKGKLKISQEAKDHLLVYGYKGNVRELENMFINFYTFCDGEIKIDALPERVKKRNSITLSLANNEKEHIIKVFNINKGNILATSKSLEIHRDTLKKKLKEYGIRNQD